MNRADNGRNDKRNIKVVHKIYPQIYSCILPSIPDHDDW